MKFLLLVSLYLLGSARGAPSQLEEPPDSLNHQDAFQPFSGVQAPAEQTSGEQAPPAEQTSGEPAPAAQAEAAQAAQAAGEQAAAEQAAAEHHPSGQEASGEQAVGENHAAAAGAGQGINCHACSYMSSEGKCLRGEGSCTIQHSQQCMLKKIFEGEKLEFMVQGCENMCPSMSLYSHGTRMQLICCRDKSFCNVT